MVWKVEKDWNLNGFICFNIVYANKGCENTDFVNGVVA